MMKKKKWIVLGILLAVIIITGMITNKIDSDRVKRGEEPKCCIKLISNDGRKITYWGIGYKVIRYVGVSPNEPYKNNIGIKMGSWFMQYDLPNEKSITIEYNGKTIEINNDQDIKKISNIITNAKYNSEICNGISTHKIIMENEIYDLKEGCQAIRKGDKQATIAKEDIETINNIISDKIKREQKIYSKKVEQTTIELSIPNEWNYEEIVPEENSNFKFALKLYKDSSDKSVTLYYYNDPFGVCGTGRTTKKIKLNNGKEATVGYYDNENEWSDISFYELNPNIALINNNTNEYANEVLEFVKTIDIKNVSHSTERKSR